MCPPLTRDRSFGVKKAKKCNKNMGTKFLKEVYVMREGVLPAFGNDWKQINIKVTKFFKWKKIRSLV